MFVKFSEVRDKTYCAVILWYNKCRCAPLGAVNFLYYIKILESIEFLFEREFMYARKRKRFPNCSLRVILVTKDTRKEKKELDFF